MKIEELTMEDELPSLLLTYHDTDKVSHFHNLSITDAFRKAPVIPKKIYLKLSNGSYMLIWSLKKGLIRFKQ